MINDVFLRAHLAATFGIAPRQVPPGLLTALAQEGRITLGFLLGSNISPSTTAIPPVAGSS